MTGHGAGLTAAVLTALLVGLPLGRWWLGRWRLARARRALADGQPAMLRVRARGNDPVGRFYVDPAHRYRRGELWLDPESSRVYFSRRRHATVRVSRGGGIQEPEPPKNAVDVPPPYLPVVVTYLPPPGGALLIKTDKKTAGVLSRFLPARPTGDAADRPLRLPASRPAPTVPAWAAGLLLLTVFLGALHLHTFALGRSTDAEVTAVRPEGTCAVRWQDPWEPERTRQSRVDCPADTAVGDVLPVSARPWPFRGQAADRVDTPDLLLGLLVLTGVPGLLGAGLATWHTDRRRRVVRELVAHDAGPDPAVPGDRPAPPPAGRRQPPPDPLRFDQMSALAADLVGWFPGPGHPRTEPDLRTAPWWRSPFLRGLALRRAVAWTALIALAVSLPVLTGVWGTAARLHLGETEQALGRVETVGTVHPLRLPTSAEVSFRTADGRRHHAWVPYLGAAPGDERPVIEYVVDDPAAAVIAGSPVHTVVAWGGAASTAVLLGLVGYRARRGMREVRARHRAAAGPQREELSYVLLPVSGLSPDLGPVLVLYRRDGRGDVVQRPWAVLPLRAGRARRPALSGVAPVGTAVLARDPDGPDADTVPLVDGLPLWPCGELRELDRDGMAELRADVADYGDEDDDEEDGRHGAGRPADGGASASDG